MMCLFHYTDNASHLTVLHYIYGKSAQELASRVRVCNSINLKLARIIELLLKIVTAMRRLDVSCCC